MQPAPELNGGHPTCSTEPQWACNLLQSGEHPTCAKAPWWTSNLQRVIGMQADPDLNGGHPTCPGTRWWAHTWLKSSMVGIQSSQSHLWLLPAHGRTRLGTKRGIVLCGSRMLPSPSAFQGCFKEPTGVQHPSKGETLALLPRAVGAPSLDVPEAMDGLWAV